jgi:hypothetical protein
MNQLSEPEQSGADAGLAVRFATAASALVFSGRLATLGRIAAGDHRRSADHSSWWVVTRLALDLGRQLAEATSGEVFLVSGPQLVRDQGWGDWDRAAARGSAERLPLESLPEVTLLDLVRWAGLHSVPAREVDEAVVLLKARLASGVIRRALELGLQVTYRPTRLAPLFDGEPVDGSRHGVVLELLLRSPRGQLPAALLDALHRDPSSLLCRRVGGEDAVLMQYRHGSPLEDGALLELAGQDVWLLAGPGFGCARLERLGEPLDGAALVALAADFPLRDAGASPDWADPEPGTPSAPRLTVVPARTSDAGIDGVLLGDAHLDSVRLLLEGHPLADSVQVVPGREQHLLLAGGGLLERLPLGLPLYCLGPGPLYLPLGHRTQPLLPPSARETLFRCDADRAVVLTMHAALVFDLSLRQPAWRLWAGPPPELDFQLPDEARSVLRMIDAKSAPAVRHRAVPPAPAPGPRPRGTGDRPRDPWTREIRPVGWRDMALEAELSGDLVRAAEIHERNDDHLRAAHLYERAAQLNVERGR